MMYVPDAPVGKDDLAAFAIPAAAAEEIARLRAENATLRQTVAALTAHVAELERRLGLNSSNSGKPPSSDGLKKPLRTKSLRESSDKPPGGQKGHPGETLRQVAEPSVILDHYPERCLRCGSALTPEMSTASSARQVFDLPEPQPLVVTEHRAHSCQCGQCGESTRAAFPDGVTAPAQYGARISAWVVYLLQYQLLAEDRLVELMADLFGVKLAAATLARMSTTCAARFQGRGWTISSSLYQMLGCGIGSRRSNMATFEKAVTTRHVTLIALAYGYDQCHRQDIVAGGANRPPHFRDFVDHLCQRVKEATVKHLDETGFRIGAKTQWLHVAVTLWLTFYRVSPKRGSLMEGLLGIIVHDHWKPYYTLKGVLHALCNAHHLRELQALIENEQESWALRMQRLLRRACHATHLARERNEPLTPRLVERFQRRYDALVAEGIAFHEAQPPLPPKGELGRRRGRLRRRTGHNLLLRLSIRRDDVLRFLTDPRVPFTNNLAEQAARMMKLRQKISGGFRSEQSARAFAVIRSLIATAKKQGWNVIHTLTQSPDSLLAKLRVA